MRITDYFQLVVERNASDLHPSSGARPMFRVAGTMIPVNDQVLTNQQVKALIAEILPERNRAEWEHYHDTDFAYQFDGTASCWRPPRRATWSLRRCTTTAAGTVDRLINQFPADEQAQVGTSLAESLPGVIAQTLCKKKAGGRAVALEDFLGSHALAANIREWKIHQISMTIQTGRKDGMCFLNDSHLDLAANGVIEPTKAYQNSVVKDELINRMSAIPTVRSPSGTR